MLFIRSLVPITSTLLLQQLMWLIGQLIVESPFSYGFNINDYFASLLLSYLLFFCIKSVTIFLLLQTTLIMLIYLSHSIKILYFSTPITMDDLINIPFLLELLPYSINALIAAGLCLWFGICIYYRRSLFHLVSACCIMWACFGYMKYFPEHAFKLLHTHPYTERQQLHYYNTVGPLHYTLKTVAHYYQIRGPIPTRQDILALATSKGHRAALIPKLTSTSKRNVYLILQESLWNPQNLSELATNISPIHPSFNQLWQKSLYSSSLSTTYGGGTAKAEFEFLCGLPHPDGTTLFNETLNDDLPCLPQLLAQHGYETTAYHPNTANFYNRDQTYPKLGFDHYHSLNHFKVSKRDGYYMLADTHFFDQLLPALTPKEKPQLHYILTIGMHWPYPTWVEDANRITSNTDNLLFERYLNLLYESTKAIATFTQRVIQQDPEALIVISGDHLPVFNSNIITQLLANQQPALSSNMQTQWLYRVPYMIIDGKHGPIPLNTIAMYDSPHLIAHILNGGSSFNLSSARPLPGEILTIDNSVATSCRKQQTTSTNCHEMWDWFADTQTILKDIVFGQQFSLEFNF